MQLGVSLHPETGLPLPPSAANLSAGSGVKGLPAQRVAAGALDAATSEPGGKRHRGRRGEGDAATTADPPGRAEGAPLDLHKVVWHPDPSHGGCGRWPENLWLVNDWGEMVRGRCRASNACAYCAKLFAVETAEMLALDAMDGDAPRVWAVLTTRTATLDVSAFYHARKLVQRAVRRRWPAAEFAWVIEWTTGYGARSGGLRRPHWNVLVKGVDTADVDQLREVIARVWCQHVDAVADAQYTGAVSEVGGLMRYLALHFLKESQQPPAGWHGHRFTATRGYFATTRPEARRNARRALQVKRELWKLGEDIPADVALESAEGAVRQRSERVWVLAHGWPTKRVTPPPRAAAGATARRAPPDMQRPIGRGVNTPDTG